MCGHCAARFRLVPPPACAYALAPRCLSMFPASPPNEQEGEVGNTAALLRE